MIFKHLLTESTATAIFEDFKNVINLTCNTLLDCHTMSPVLLNNYLTRLFHDLNRHNVKKAPLPAIKFYRSIIFTSNVRSQSSVSGFHRKIFYLYYCNLQEICKVYLSIYPEETIQLGEGSEQMYDFRSGSLPRIKEPNDNRYLQLFINLYADEIQCADPLGAARSQKYWMIYAQILNLPRNVRSSLDSIFLLGVFDSKVLQNISLNAAIKMLIVSMHKSCKPFTVENYSKQVLVTVLGFIGDSPASNYFGGNFKVSFLFFRTSENLIC